MKARLWPAALLVLAPLLLYLLSCAVAGAPPAPDGAARPVNPNEVIVPPERLETVAGFRVSAGEEYDTNPAAAVTADGTTWVAWVRHRPGGADEVVARALPSPAAGRPVPAKISPVETVSGAPGQYVRPVLAATGADLWCFWTATAPDRTAQVWHCRRSGKAWGPAARFLPDESRPHQNPEAAAGPGGALAVVYQVHDREGYDIHLALWDGKAWTPPRALSDAATNDGDPVALYDARGRFHVAWSGYRDGDYDVYLLSGGEPARRISARGEYDLHPWLAAAPDGAVWINWDVVRIANHNGSGKTTITGANLRGRPNGGDVSSARSEWSGIEVRVLDGDRLRVPGRPRDEIVAPKGYRLGHRGLAKVAIGPRGEPFILYRAMLRTHAAWSAQVRDGYLWELQGRAFRDGRWQEPVLFLESDGYLEEPAVAASPGGLRVAYGTEHRHSTARRVLFHEPHGDGYDHRHDFEGFTGWNGDVTFATVPAGGAGPAVSSLPVAAAPPDRPSDAFLPRDAGRHEVRSGERTYRLLWGDTHRHSNLSRCSVGLEPNPEDLYRYGADVHRFNFFALSDHAEYTTDYFWWRQQKFADLFHVPGSMTALYNYEWSLRFPHGHHNTIFPSRPTVKLHGWMGASASLVGGWKVLEREGLKAITIPHTGADPGMGTAWEVHDDRYQRLCEIFQSCRGSYEHEGCPRQFDNTRNKKGFYWNALEKGYHVGVIASSDHGYGTAYACVYAPRNTREAVWQALWDRRTYGSTAYGLVLELRSGSRWMGEEWSSREAPALDVYVRGARPLRSVEILGRSKVLHVEKPSNALEHRLRWADPEWSSQTREQWYYVRVVQEDDEMAWSSPVWVKPEK